MYLLYEETNVSTVIDRNRLVDKLLDTLNCGQFLLHEHDDKQTVIIRTLKSNSVLIGEALRQLEIYFYLWQLIESTSMTVNQAGLDTMVNWLFMRAIFTPSNLTYWKNVFLEHQAELSQNTLLHDNEAPEIRNKGKACQSLAVRFAEQHKTMESVIHKWMLFSHRQPKNIPHPNVDNTVMHNLFMLWI